MTTPKTTPDGIEIPPPGPDDVLYEKADVYARIVLNRPTILNAMNKNVQRLLLAAFERAEADDDVKVVVLTARAGHSPPAATCTPICTPTTSLRRAESTCR